MNTNKVSKGTGPIFGHLVAVVGAIIALAIPAWAADPDPPNIVLIFADDLGFGDVACFGGTGVATPNLDRLAREGRKFTNFRVSSPVCSASRAALLTGCYHSRVGIHGALGPRMKIGLNPAESTIAEVIKPAGYVSAIVGKWHLGRPPELLPTRQGFDEYFGLPYSNDMWPRHPEAASGTYPALPLIEGEKVIEEMPDQNRLTVRYTERAVDFINRNRQRRFFLYLAHNMPHVPLGVSEAFRGRSARGLYGDVIEEIDWSVGEVLRALEAHDLGRRTLVIFTSDNGPWLSYGDHAGSAGPLREGKGTSWEGGVRVPCLMRWPDVIPAGTECREPLVAIDILPTLARITGSALPPHQIDGRDVHPLLTGQPGATSPHEAIFTYFGANELQAIVSGRWKLVLPHQYRTLGDQPRASGGKPIKYRTARVETPQLFDLESDLGETRNRADSHPEIIERLLKHVESARADLGDSLTQRKGSGLRPAGQVP